MSGLQRATQLTEQEVDVPTPRRRPMNFGASNQDRQRQIKLSQLALNFNAFEDKGLRPQVFEKALTAFRTAYQNGDTESMIFTIIDFELSSKENRLWVINLENSKLLHHERVTHGRNSDKNYDGMVDGPSALSNQDSSYKSNIGLLKTAETYHSSKFGGTSLRMDGLEEGFNDNARDRAIVMHPAKYADRGKNQILGRSLGCPALDPDVSGEIIETIKNGTLIFQYYPDPNWLEKSTYLN